MDRIDREELDDLVLGIQFFASLVIAIACSYTLSGWFGLNPLGSALMGLVIFFVCFYYSFDIIAIIQDAMSEGDNSIRT